MMLSASVSLILAGLLALQQTPRVEASTARLSGHTNQLARDAYVKSRWLHSPPPWHNQRRSVPLPAKRSYDSHHYYVVELDPRSADAVDPREVAEVLNAEYVERAGELKHHYLLRSEKQVDLHGLAARDSANADLVRRADIPLDRDPILKRWQEIRSSRPQLGALAKRQRLALLSIRDVERQEVRRRHKRDKIYDPAQMRHVYPVVRSPLPGSDLWAAEAGSLAERDPRPPMLPVAKSAAMMGDFNITDPIFTEQWHLANDKKQGFDLNVTGVWKENIHGKGVNVCLIDDGLDMHSPDLADNFFAAGSYDFNAHVELPEPREADDQHGTRCAGEIAAIKNDVCGVGVAYHAKVSAVRILSGPISDVDEAAALNYAYQDNHVYSCSWGPPDDGRSMDAPKGLIAKAILNGIQNGREGKGSIFVFAGGNGGAADDQCNFDGYTNSIYSMTIAAVDREGQHPYYSEMCSAILATGWSSGSGDHIHTTDVAWNGINRCSAHHGGTSAAAPLVAGVVALALEVRPDLTWRDVQHVAVRSAIMVNPEDKDWQKTQAGRHYNHKYGYGLIDAYQFVEEAKRHKLVTPQAWFESPNITLPATETFISDAGTTSSFTVTQKMLDDANVAALEHITVKVWITHQRRGDVNIELTSPHGTKSALARSRRYDDATTGFPGWSFMTLKHWDESPIGEWTIRVFDPAHPDQTGNLYAWSLTLWGASIDPNKAVPWDFPVDSVEYHETLASAPSTTVVHLAPSATAGAGASTATKLSKPTDHLPENHGSASGENHIDFTNGDPVRPEADTGYIGGIKKNSTWIIVALGVVVIFAASLAAFFILRRHKGADRNRSGAAGDYQFVPEDEEVQMSALERGASRSGGIRRGGRRTKELYDAFAEGSDDEDDGDDDAVADSAGRRLLSRGGGASGLDRPYRDDDDDDEGEDKRFVVDDEAEAEAEGEKGGVEKSKTAAAGEEEDLLDRDSGSGSGSWQDAAAEAKE
ncbi:pheromone processing endoprotease [Thecaphora frezii]